jgi:WD40 repeat protein
MMSKPASPYKGLNAFGDSELDALLFFGRERETAIVVANLIASRLTVLYGPSGVGKSSLLRAAVARSLRALPEEPLVVVFSSWSDDPNVALSVAVGEAAGRPTNGSAVTALELAQSDRDVYLVLDQAEEYFLYHADDAGPGSFAEALPSVLGTPLRINVLISLREDSLAKLDRFTGRIPGLFANTLRLDRLDRRSARAAILGPAERYSEIVGVRVDVEPDLAERVLDEVGAGQIESALGGLGAVERDDGGARIEAPYLQLVMQRIWDEEVAEGSQTLRTETLERLGGSQRIVEEHLEGAMDELSGEQKDLAARLFNHLVTPSGTKFAHEISDLAEFGRVPVDQVSPVLSTLSERRILRADEEGGTVRYEIFHDVLGQPVLAWRTRHRTQREIERQLAEAHGRRSRLMRLFAVVLVALGLMAALAVFAVTQRNDARAESDRAKGRELAASALAELTVDPQLSVLLASEAVRLAPSTELEDVLRRSLEASKLRLVLEADGSVNAAAFSPDDAHVVTASDDGRARIVDSRSGVLEAELAHDGPVREAWFSPDGATVATASDDGTARLWSSAGAQLQVLAHKRAVVSTARFANDGRRLVTAGADRTARVWAAADGRPLLTIPHGGPVLSAVFSPDGGRIATVSERRDTRVTARVFDGRTGRLLYSPDQLGVTSVVFSPDSRLLVTTSSDRTARILRAADGKLLHVLDQPDGHVVGAAFSPDGTQLVTASDGGSARVWDVATGGRLLVLVGPTNPFTGASFSPDGAFILVSSLDRTARIYRADNGLQVAVLLGHTDGVTRASFSTDGRRVVTASIDKTARVWDPGAANALELVGDSGAPVLTAELSPDGHVAVSGDSDGSLRIWDVERMKAVRTHKVGGSVDSVAVSPDGRWVVAGAPPVHARVWDLATGEEVRALLHPATVSRVAHSKDGTRLLVAGGPAARVWSAGDGALIQEVATDHVTSADISADGSLVVVGGPDGFGSVWTVETGELLHRLDNGSGPLTTSVFDPTGQVVLTAAADGTARLWSARRGELLHVLDGHAEAVLAAAFNHDGSVVATASQDGDAQLWDVSTGASLHVLRGHFNPVYSIAFDPSGRWIVTGSQRTAGLWPMSSGLLRQYLRGHELPVVSVEFASTSWRILTASQDGTVRTWTCETCGEIPELLALATERLERAGRQLTLDERERYVG